MRTLGCSPARQTRLPRALVALAARLEQVDALGDDLAVQCDAAVARRLTDAMWSRATELATQGRLSARLPENVDDLGRVLDARTVVEIIAAVVATGLDFDVARTRPGRSKLAKARYLLDYALGGSAIRTAKRAVSGRRHRGVCLQFANATRVLFYALKRATGAPARAFIPEINGVALDLATTREQHAWNWLVDDEGGVVAAFDVSARASRESLSFEIQLPRYRNVSAFLASSYGAAIGAGSVERADVAELLQATIELDTERGQVLLFHVADHLMVPVNVRRWISEHLEAVAFDRVVPGFRQRLVQRDADLGRMGRLVLTTADHDVQPFADLVRTA